MRPTTVREAIADAARRAGVPAWIVIERRTEEHLGKLSPRYRGLAERVLLKLPEDWDSHVSQWEMFEDEDVDAVDPHYYARARLLAADGDAGQQWDVRLCTSRLATLPDDAVCGVIAHELAHVASALPHGSGRSIAMGEDRANAIARWWGFGRELDAAKRHDRRRLGYEVDGRPGPPSLEAPLVRAEDTRRVLLLTAVIVAVVIGGVAAFDWLVMDQVIE
jgi:hypothetical protein